MRNVIIFVFALLLFLPCLSAQIVDDFSDGNLNQNLEWIGDTADFTINPDGQLLLNASQSGVSAIAVCVDSLDIWNVEVEWYLKIKENFAPSNNNYGRFYLLSNSENLKSDTITAFYLQFGENLSEDAIELFYTERGLTVSVLRGTNGMIANPFELGVKVEKSADGEWSLLVDELNIGWYRPQAEGTSVQQFDIVAAGLLCKYTSSNANKFAFDDFYIGSPIIDSIKPYAKTCYGSDDLMTVALTFSEMVNESALESSHYFVPDLQLYPLACEYLFPDYRRVMLYFPVSFSEDRIYNLQISNIQDLAQNIMEDTVLHFSFHKMKRNDIIFTEIMADPQPSVGLPPVEYIELYNTVNQDFEFSMWKIKVGTSFKTLPDLQFQKNGFVVIVADENVFLMKPFCEAVYGVPSLSISDGGQELILYNQYDEIMHIVRFSDSWHRNSIKREGGWSLEMKDVLNPCAGEDNWDSSVDVLGGTPGRLNSIFADNPDTEAPKILSVTIIDSFNIRINFSEEINLKDYRPNFIIDHNMNIVSCALVQPYNNAVDLRLGSALRAGVVYRLEIADSICDCAGRWVPLGEGIFFGLDDAPSYNDLVINEILFDPPDGDDADFVEIYNRSSKIIDLKKVKIGSGSGQLPDKAVTVFSRGYQLFPGTMAAACKNVKLTSEHYLPPPGSVLLPCDSLPSFANSQGVTHLTDLSLQCIDRFSYDEKMHYPMLSSVDGVSLERVHYEGETQNVNNWKSAAASVNFATPGYRNSQFADGLSAKDMLEIVPEVFSPDNDGFEDFAEVLLHFEELENRVTVEIFDLNSLLIKTISNNEMVGAEARFLWDGTDDNGRGVPPGMYVIKISYWNLSGRKRTSRKVVSVWGK